VRNSDKLKYISFIFSAVGIVLFELACVAIVLFTSKKVSLQRLF